MVSTVQGTLILQETIGTSDVVEPSVPSIIIRKKSSGIGLKSTKFRGKEARKRPELLERQIKGIGRHKLEDVKLK